MIERHLFLPFILPPTKIRYTDNHAFRIYIYQCFDNNNGLFIETHDVLNLDVKKNLVVLLFHGFFFNFFFLFSFLFWFIAQFTLNNVCCKKVVRLVCYILTFEPVMEQSRADCLHLLRSIYDGKCILVLLITFKRNVWWYT